jgi:hypothetical protein
MDKKDLEAVEKVFELLSKAKWDNVDGDFIINNYFVLANFKKLEDKIKKILDPPKIEEAQKTNIKKPKKIKDVAKPE